MNAPLRPAPMIMSQDLYEDIVAWSHDDVIQAAEMALHAP